MLIIIHELCDYARFFGREVEEIETQSQVFLEEAFIEVLHATRVASKSFCIEPAFTQRVALRYG